MNKIIEKKCPSCDKVISIKAKKCPYCQSDLRNWFSRHPILTFLGILLLIPFIISSIASPSGSNEAESATSGKSENPVKVSVLTDGIQIHINNLEESDCVNARMEINGGLFKGGYVLDGNTLEGKTEYTVGAGQFTDKDGNRFAFQSKKIQSFQVYCRGENDLNGRSWYGNFK